MKMKNLKLSKADQEKRMEPSAVDADAPRYPWGLSLSLDNETLDKLGIEKLPTVGDELVLLAQVKVTGVQSYDSASGKSRSVSLQITEAALEAEKKGKSAVEALYEDAEA